MADAANRIAGTELDVALLAAEAEASGNSFLEYWGLAATSSGNAIASRLGELALRIVESRTAWRAVVAEALVWLPETAKTANGVVSDAAEDKAAWETAARAIRAEKGGEVDLAELLQGLALRPKEPPPDPCAVGLSTIHSVKGCYHSNSADACSFAGSSLSRLAEGTVPLPSRNGIACIETCGGPCWVGGWPSLSAGIFTWGAPPLSRVFGDRVGANHPIHLIHLMIEPRALRRQPQTRVATHSVRQCNRRSLDFARSELRSG